MNRICRNCFFFIFKISYALHYTELRSTKHYSLNWMKIFRVCAHWISNSVTNAVSRLCCQFQTTLDTHYSSTARASIRYANPSAKCVEKHSHHLKMNTSSLRTWADRVACTSTSNNLLTGGSGSAAPATERLSCPIRHEHFDVFVSNMLHDIDDISTRAATSYVIHSKCFHFHEKC